MPSSAIRRSSPTSSASIRRSTRKSLAAIVVALAAGLGLLSATPAQAHSALVSSDPADGQTVIAGLDRVALTFSEAPLTGLDAGLRIEVRDAAGTDQATGDVAVDGMTMSRSVDLEDGAYTVLWRYVSPDGHPITGELGFTVARPAAAPAASATASTPTAEPTGTSQTVTATRTAAPAAAAAGGHHSSAGPVVWLAGGAVLVAALAGILAVARRRRLPVED